MIAVSTRECNLYHDSYFYCTYWNEGKEGLEEFTEVMIGSTAYAGGRYNEEITASPEVKEKHSKWLEMKAKYDQRFIIKKGDVVYSPNARKYKSSGLVFAVAVDRYDSREWIAGVEFAEGTCWMRTNKLVKIQPFVPEYF
jgi:hypothetical protein